jgi:hypothetical protein
VYIRNELCIHLVELIDTNREKKTTGKGWQPVGRMLIGETHHYTLIAAVCTLRPAGIVPIIQTTFDIAVLATVATISPRRCPSCGGYEDAMGRRGRISVGLKTHAQEALPVSTSVAKASYGCQTLRINSASLQSLHA